MLGILLGCAQSGRCERIKDIVDIQGVRGNPLSGVGLVIGLAGTGDATQSSRQMLTNILRDSGLVLSPKDLTGGNIAIVMVTAELGPFAREGSRIDIDVSAIGDAKSLQGGMLLPTPLKGLDDQVYAVGQGGISLAAGRRAEARPPFPRTIRPSAEYPAELSSKKPNWRRSWSKSRTRGLSL